MGILDNDTVIVDAILTKLGRQKLANGQPLGVSQYAFGDTGVDYTLYNADHPSGSDSYGNAITSLPMLEAVPDDNVFLRFKLYGEGERNVENFSFITVTSGTSVTITKVPGETESNPIIIVPRIFPVPDFFVPSFKILDARGLTIRRGSGAEMPSDAITFSGDYDINNLPSFSVPEPVIATVLGNNINRITLNAQPQQITSPRTIGVEITSYNYGAAPAFVSVTIDANNTTA